MDNDFDNTFLAGDESEAILQESFEATSDTSANENTDGKGDGMGY